MPKRAVFERSHRELSLDVSVGVHILLAVEQSSLENQSRGCAKTLILTVLTGFLPSSAAAAFIYLFKPPYAIGSVPSLSGHAIAYLWRSLPRVRRHRASKSQGSSSNGCCLGRSPWTN